MKCNMQTILITFMMNTGVRMEDLQEKFSFSIRRKEIAEYGMHLIKFCDQNTYIKDLSL